MSEETQLFPEQIEIVSSQEDAPPADPGAGVTFSDLAETVDMNDGNFGEDPGGDEFIKLMGELSREPEKEDGRHRKHFGEVLTKATDFLVPDMSLLPQGALAAVAVQLPLDEHGRLKILTRSTKLHEHILSC